MTEKEKAIVLSCLFIDQHPDITSDNLPQELLELWLDDRPYRMLSCQDNGHPGVMAFIHAAGIFFPVRPAGLPEADAFPDLCELSSLYSHFQLRIQEEYKARLRGYHIRSVRLFDFASETAFPLPLPIFSD